MMMLYVHIKSISDFRMASWAIRYISHHPHTDTYYKRRGDVRTQRILSTINLKMWNKNPSVIKLKNIYFNCCCYSENYHHVVRWSIRWYFLFIFLYIFDHHHHHHHIHFSVYSLITFINIYCYYSNICNYYCCYAHWVVHQRSKVFSVCLPVYDTIRWSRTSR